MRGTDTAGALWCGAAGGVLSGLGFLVYALVVLATDTALRPLSSWLEARRQAPVGVETAYRILVACGEKERGTMRIVPPGRTDPDAITTVHGASRRDAEAVLVRRPRLVP